MEFSNAQKLASVLSEWSRPAISQIASGKIMQIPMMKSLQATIVGSGIVGQGYNLSKEIEPMIQPAVDSLITPILSKYISNIPDEAIPQMARSVVQRMRLDGEYSILDGFITFDEADLEELEILLDKNLPVFESERYIVIH